MDGVIYATPEEAAADEEKQQKAAEEERKAELVRRARERFTMAQEAERDIRMLADEDIRFRAGEQWDSEVLRNRTVDKRPALVINRMPQFERQITNEQRQARPAIQVSPIDSNADVKTAEVFQGLIRHIEVESNADVAYDTGLTSAVRGGFGYIRILSEYEEEESFLQCLKIKRVRDPFSVYFDPCAQEQDGSDADWAFVVDDGISEDEFKAQYPDAMAVKGGWGDRSTNSTSRTCQVVEYFYRERVKDTLLQLQPVSVAVDQMGQPVFDPNTGQPVMVPSGEPITALESCLPEGAPKMRVLSSRPTYRTKVCWAKIAGSTVVEETEFPSKWIPIIPVLGDELWVGGKRILEGVVRNAKDAQRMYNYWSSAITETIALAPKAPFIGAGGQFAGYEKKWADASRRNLPYLEYKPVALNGQLAPPPTRNAFDAPIAPMVQALSLASDDMKATTGIYDAALGNRSNEQSGIAIRARQSQSQTSTVHFSDNLARALRHVGKILIDAIPRVYGTERIVRVLGEDETEKMVAINGAPPVKGQERVYDLGVGRYDVAVSMGASFASKRQEAVAASLELSRSNPQIASAIADIMVRNMDWPGAQEMADRLQKLLPPALQPPGKDMPPAQVLMQQVQQLKAQQQHAGVMIEKLAQQLHNAHDRIDTKQQELQSKERIALIDAQVKLLTTKAELHSEDANAALDRMQGDLHKRLELDGISQPMDDASTKVAPTPQPERFPHPMPPLSPPISRGVLNVRGQPAAPARAPGPIPGEPPGAGGAGGPFGGGPGGPGGFPGP